MRLLIAILMLCSVVWSRDVRQFIVRTVGKSGGPVAGVRIFAGEQGMVVTNENGEVLLDSGTSEPQGLVLMSEAYVEVERRIHGKGSPERVEIVLERVREELPEVVIESSPLARESRYFSRADFVRSGATDVAEFLQRAGLDLRTDGGEGSQAVARIGGSNANQVVVLLDGVPLNSGGTGSADLSGIRLERLEAIEMTRGAKPEISAEGIGGVIDLKSLQLARATPLEFGAEYHGYVSRFQASRTQALGSFYGRVEYEKVRGSGKYRYRIGEDDVLPLDTEFGREYERENNEVNANRFGIQFQSHFAQNIRVAGSAELLDEQRGMPGYLVPNLTPEAEQKSGLASSQITVQKVASHWSLSQRISTRHESRDYSDPASPFIKESQESGSRNDFVSEFSGYSKHLSLLLGGGLTDESLSGTQIEEAGRQRRRLESWSKLSGTVYGEESKFHLDLNGAVRYSKLKDNELLTPRIEGRTGVGGSLPTSVAISWGKSQRIPDLYSLFWLEDQFATGNPDLLPEESEDRFLHFSIEHERMGNKLNIQAGDQDVRELIVWRAGFDGRWKPMNVARARIKTLTVDLTQLLWNDRVHVSGGADWTEARDQGSDPNTGGRYLTFRAPRTFRAGVDLSLGNWSASTRYRYVDARPATESNTKWLALYRLLEVDVRREFAAGKLAGEVAVGGRNLLNENYRIVRHAPMPLREVYLGLKLRAKGSANS